MECRQREFLLRQRLAAIEKELGKDGDDDVIEEYRRSHRKRRPSAA
jgi:ATP-dependent Lon protease